VNGEEILLTVDYEGGNRGLPTSDGSLPELTDSILSFLGERGARATFFVVGAVAEAHPALVERIVSAGHELALHTCDHTPLSALGRQGFARDTRRGLELLAPFAPDGRVRGFRAPFFGISQETRWAFDVLAELGFAYDSSVIPVWNPVCGSLPGESRYIRRLSNGLWSVPVSVFHVTRRLGVPVAGGVYLRLLPEWITWRAAERYWASGEPLNVYFHPYDLRPGAPTGPVFGRNLILNTALRLGRGRMLARIARLIEGRRTWRVIDYIEARAARPPSPNGR
jgi:polysaccharide deacetylase family protein (PEP-CTERM system associated)